MIPLAGFVSVAESAAASVRIGSSRDANCAMHHKRRAAGGRTVASCLMATKSDKRGRMRSRTSMMMMMMDYVAPRFLHGDKLLSKLSPSSPSNEVQQLHHNNNTQHHNAPHTSLCRRAVTG
ncbi:hypothetical protein N9L68_02675 [bacterium]|nr:hypothetical protein [bacterium]